MGPALRGLRQASVTEGAHLHASVEGLPGCFKRAHEMEALLICGYWNCEPRCTELHQSSQVISTAKNSVHPAVYDGFCSLYHQHNRDDESKVQG